MSGIPPAAEYVCANYTFWNEEIATGWAQGPTESTARWTWAETPLMITWPPQAPALIGGPQWCVGPSGISVGSEPVSSSPRKVCCFLFPSVQWVWSKAIGPLQKSGRKISSLNFRLLSQGDPPSPSFKRCWECKLAQVWELIEGPLTGRRARLMTRDTRKLQRVLGMFIVLIVVMVSQVYAYVKTYKLCTL